jgi:acylphosphatase
LRFDLAMLSRQAFYEGRVQGVGFRWTVKNVARGFDVVGSVRNLDDGRVEVQVRGEADEVEAFLEAIAESELKSHIKRIEVHPLAAMPATRGFEIVP